MRAAIEAKGVSLTDCEFTGAHFDALIRLLYRNQDRMSVDLTDLEQSDLILFKIDTGDSPPIKGKRFRRTPAEQVLIQQEVQKLIDANLVEISDTVYESPILIVQKGGNRGIRIVQDFRALNAVTRQGQFCLPDFQEIVNEIGSRKVSWFSNLDLRSAFWQASLAPEDRHKTGFVCPNIGPVHWRVMAQGLSGASAHCQRLLMLATRGLVPDVLQIFIDDLLVYGRTQEEMMNNLDLVFDRLRKAKLKISADKCHFGLQRIRFLGHIFSSNGLEIDPKKYDIVRNFPIPTTPRRVKGFLGLTGFFRRFVEGYAQISAPLRALLRADQSFIWNENCQWAFEFLKFKLTHSPVVLKLPDFSKGFQLHVDAAATGGLGMDADPGGF